MYLIKRKSVYYIRFFDQYENRLKQFSTKCSNKKDALQFLTNFREEQRQKKKLNFISLDNFRNEYLQHIGILHSRKYYTSINYTFLNLIDHTGDIALIRLDRNTLEKFLLDTFQKAKHNAWHYYRNLRAAFNYAIDKNYLEVNPIQDIKLPKIPDKINLYITEHEIEEIISKTEDEQLRDLFRFAYNSGMRLGEIVNLKWSAVSFTDRLIKVEGDESFRTKGNKSRIIPINNILNQILKNRLPKVIDIKKDVYVFHKYGRRLHADTISRIFKQAVIDARLNPEYHFHTMRNSFISNLAKKNVPLIAIMKIAGHSSIKITERHYLSVQNDLLTQAMHALDTNLSKAVHDEI